MSVKVGVYQSFPTPPQVISHVCVKVDGTIHLYEGNSLMGQEHEEEYTVVFASNLDRLTMKGAIEKVTPDAKVVMK